MMARSVLCAARRRKSRARPARVLPQTSRTLPHERRRPDRVAARNTSNDPRNTTMPRNDTADRDPNAELRSFEPLRVSLALGALLLGLLLGLH